MVNKKIVISFDEGCSGNFLAALITNSMISSYERIDNRSSNKLNYDIIPFFNNNFVVQKSVIVTHERDTDKIIDKLNPDIIIRILPITGIFTAIYNVFIKKHIEEKRSDIIDKWNTVTDTAYCYDMTFEHLKDYYNIFSSRTLSYSQILFDFGWFYDFNKITEFLDNLDITYNGDLIKNYQSSQLPLLLSMPSITSMESICADIPNEYFINSPWFACYCIFCFENLNGLSENNRLWTIDSLNTVLTAPDLIKLSKKYYV